MKYNNFIFKFLLFGGLLLSSCNDVPSNTSSDFFKLETPKNIYVDNDNYIHWDKVPKASYYNICIMINNEDGMFGIGNEGSSRNECSIMSVFRHGEIPYNTPTELKISVMAKGNGGVVVDSDYSDEYVYTYTRFNTEISEELNLSKVISLKL